MLNFYPGETYPAGSITTERKFVQALTAMLTFAGSIASRKTTHQLSASIRPFMRSLNLDDIVILRSQLSFQGTLPRNIYHPLSASLSFLGSIANRVTTHRLSASLTFVGSLFPKAIKTLSASLSFSGFLGKNIDHQLPGSLSFVGSIQKYITHSLPASLSFVGSIANRITTHPLQASLSFVGSIANRTTTHGLIAQALFKAEMNKDIISALRASLSFAASVASKTTHQLPASLSFVGSLAPFVTKTLSSTLSFVGSIANRTTTHQLPASLSFVGSIANRTTIKQLMAVLTFAGSLFPKIVQKLSATLSFAASIANRKTTHELPAVASFVTSIQKYITHQLPGMVNFFVEMNFNHTHLQRLVARLFFVEEPCKLLDTLEREEAELNNEGKWKRLPRDASPGSTKPDGYVGVLYPAEYGAYWTPTIFEEPIQISIRINELPQFPQRYFSLYGNLSFPGVDESGYRVRFEEISDPKGEGYYTIYLEKITEGKFTILAQVTGILIAVGNKLTFRLENGELSVFVAGAKVLSVFDFTYNSGYVGLGASGIYSRMSNFEVCELIGSAVHLGKNITHQLRAQLLFTASLAKKGIQALRAVLSFSGSIQKDITHQFPAAVSFAVEMQRKLTHVMAAVLSFTGSIANRKITHQLFAELRPFVTRFLNGQIVYLRSQISFNAALPLKVEHTLRSSLSFLAQIPSKTVHQLRASLSFAGSLTPIKIVTMLLKATLSFVGTLNRNITHQLSATLTSSAFLGKNITHPLSAKLTFAANMLPKIIHALTASLTFVGTLPRNITHRLTSTVSMVAAMNPKTTKAQQAIMSFTGSLNRNITHQLRSSISFAVTLFPIKTIVQRLQATLSFAVTLKQKVIKNFKAVLTFRGNLGFGTFLRFIGIDKFVVTQVGSVIELIKLAKKPVVADEFIHKVEGVPTLIEYAPNTVENELFIPDDVEIIEVGGLEERDKPPFFEGDGLPHTEIESGGSRVVFEPFTRKAKE